MKAARRLRTCDAALGITGIRLWCMRVRSHARKLAAKQSNPYKTQL